MKATLVKLVAFQAGCCAAAVLAYAVAASAQAKTYERTFPQSKAVIEKTLEGMRASLSGHLPVLDGFAAASDPPSERYQRGYYQANVMVTPNTSGSTVRVSVKVTAWYRDSDASHSGYQLLPSNGRIETDILDQLSDQFASLSPAPAGTGAKQEGSNKPPVPDQQAAPAGSDLQNVPSAPSSTFQQSLAARLAAPSQPEPEKPMDLGEKRLQAELEQLQEVLKNQEHPKNLVVVKKAGTPVVSAPSLNSKALFLASAHDEFELLNFNRDWVHVRISGLSRGWIWRNALDMPGDVPDTQAEPQVKAAADLFHVAREETGSFPGDWEPLRGKNVKIISVQKVDESAKNDDPEIRLEFAKSVFDKSYAEVALKSSNLEGIVLIFDSSDGGLIAAPETTLAKWKAGMLSDAALWQQCFFDPPEVFTFSNSSASR